MPWDSPFQSRGLRYSVLRVLPRMASVFGTDGREWEERKRKETIEVCSLLETSASSVGEKLSSSSEFSVPVPVPATGFLGEWGTRK